MIPEKDEKQVLHELVLENQRLLIENNQLMHKINNRILWAFWIKILWFVVIIGIPFVLYYYVSETYFDSLGSSFEVFRDSVREIPGWKQFYETTSGESAGGE